ncbi:MAG: hypothetical protein WC852_02080 [Candidatus Nanoarchaeia archaeon]
MKTAIIGLAALVAGCATAAQQMPRFETAVTASAPAAVQVPAYSSEAPLPSETFSYDTGYRAESEEIVTMDTHGYTIQSGNIFFMHTENRPQSDVLANPVINGGCENMLRINNESGSQRWLDKGCEGLIDVYEEFDADNQPFARESPVGEGNTALYGSHFNSLLVEEVDAIWRGRWNVPNRREIIHYWNYPRQ